MSAKKRENSLFLEDNLKSYDDWLKEHKLVDREGKHYFLHNNHCNSSVSSPTKRSDNYATDIRIMELFDNWFDPCPLNENPDFDGLSIKWKDKTYVNPPYSNPLEWVIKAIEENKKGKLIVMLLRMDTSTRWFKLLQENNAVFLWVNGRLRFNNGKPANFFPSMLVILNKRHIFERS